MEAILEMNSVFGSSSEHNRANSFRLISNSEEQKCEDAALEMKAALDDMKRRSSISYMRLEEGNDTLDTA